MSGPGNGDDGNLPPEGAREGNRPTDSPETPKGAADPRQVAARLDYEMGLSLRVIGSKVGVSEAMVRKWAKAGEWKRGEGKPISTRVADVAAAQAPAPTPAKVTAIRPGIKVEGAHGSQGTQSGACEPDSAANCEPTANLGHDQPLDQQLAARVRQMLVNPTREEAVEVAAAAVVQVVMTHRKGVHKLQAIVDKLAGQLDFASDEINRGLIEAAIYESTEPGKARNALLEMVSLRSHAGTAKDLATAMTKLVLLERQAFGLAMTDDPTPPPPPEEIPQAEASVFDQIRARARARLAASGQATDVEVKTA